VDAKVRKSNQRGGKKRTYVPGRGAARKRLHKEGGGECREVNFKESGYLMRIEEIISVTKRWEGGGGGWGGFKLKNEEIEIRSSS